MSKRKSKDSRTADEKRFNVEGTRELQQGESSASGANRPQEVSIDKGTQWCTDSELHEISENPAEAFNRMKNIQEETKKLKSQLKRLNEPEEENRKSWTDFHDSYSSTLKVHMPCIKPVVTLLEAWAANKVEVNLELAENQKYTSMLNKILRYMILGQYRTGVLTDSQIYIFLRIDPGEEGVPLVLTSCTYRFRMFRIVIEFGCSVHLFSFWL